MNNGLPSDALAELIADKHDVLEQLRQLSQRQSDLIARDDMPRLLTVLSAKQALLNQLRTVERQLDSFRQEHTDQRRWRSPEDRQRCQQMAQRCAVLLRDIMAMESQSEAALQRRRQDASETLSGAHAARAYGHCELTARSQCDLTSDAQVTR